MGLASWLHQSLSLSLSLRHAVCFLGYFLSSPPAVSEVQMQAEQQRDLPFLDKTTCNIMQLLVNVGQRSNRLIASCDWVLQPVII